MSESRDIVGIVKEAKAMFEKSTDSDRDEQAYVAKAARHFNRVANALMVAVDMLQMETGHHSERCSCFLCSTLYRIRSL